MSASCKFAVILLFVLLACQLTIALTPPHHAERPRDGSGLVRSAKCQLKLTNCDQSSNAGSDAGIIKDFRYYCDKAIDGNTTQSMLVSGVTGGICTHTQDGANNWWAASTERPALIEEVRIFNRLDCCSHRLNDFFITVDGHECASYKSDRAFSVKTFRCGKVGQTLMIVSRRTVDAYLSLCEVQAFGHFVERSNSYQLQLSNCAQSSIHNHECGRAIDGNTNQRWEGLSCTHTDSGPNQWWSATTQQLAVIKEVKIFNRIDSSRVGYRLNDFYVTVDGEEVYSHTSNSVFSVLTIPCHKVGRRITINSRLNDALTLCEVQVFGKYVDGSGNRSNMLRCSAKKYNNGNGATSTHIKRIRDFIVTVNVKKAPEN